MGSAVLGKQQGFRSEEHGEDRGIQINQEKIRGYLEMLRQKGRSQETIRMYEAKLKALVAYLPPSGYLMRDSLLDWRETLLQSYSPRTVNTCLSAANGLLGVLGTAGPPADRAVRDGRGTPAGADEGGIPPAVASGKNLGEGADVPDH